MDSVQEDESSSSPDPIKPASETGMYPNLFTDHLGKSDEEIQAKISAAWDQLLHGDDVSERVMMLGYLQVSGNFRIYEPITTP